MEVTEFVNEEGLELGLKLNEADIAWMCVIATYILGVIASTRYKGRGDGYACGGDYFTVSAMTRLATTEQALTTVEITEIL